MFELHCFLNLSEIRYGGERYEKREMQIRVRERFSELQLQDEQSGQVPWHVVNAARSIEQVQEEINAIVEKTIETIEGNTLGRLWQSVPDSKKSDS